MKRATILVMALILMLLTGHVLAMSSANYRLDWFVPLTGGGGGSDTSAHYAVNFTVGQSARGATQSTNYKGCLGYWCGAGGQYHVHLPLMLRNYP